MDASVPKKNSKFKNKIEEEDTMEDITCHIP